MRIYNFYDVFKNLECDIDHTLRAIAKLDSTDVDSFELSSLSSSLNQMGRDLSTLKFDVESLMDNMSEFDNKVD